MLRENERNDVLVAGVDGLLEAVEDIASGTQYVAMAANDSLRLGKVTIQTAVNVAAGTKMPPFIDAGTVLIDKQTVSGFNTSGLFARRAGASPSDAPQTN